MGNWYTDGPTLPQSDVSIDKRKKLKRSENGVGLAFWDNFNNETQNITEDGIVDYKYWDENIEYKNDKETDEASFHLNTLTLKRKGKVYPMFNEDFEDNLLQYVTPAVNEVYQTHGSLRFRASEIFHNSKPPIKIKKVIIPRDMDDTYYVGEIDSETKEKHGRGLWVYSDRSLFEGFFKNGMRNGMGRMIYANGDTYQGEYRDDMYHGYGTFISKSGKSCKGYWEFNKLHSKGYECIKGQYWYRGKYKKGVKQGHGHMVWDNKDEYIGEFYNDEIHGKGKLIYQDGHVYDGEFRNGWIHGTGYIKWPDGEKYKGGFEKSKMHGHGAIKYTNKRTYDGTWAYGLKDGKGIISDSDGNTKESVWDKGELVEPDT